MARIKPKNSIVNKEQAIAAMAKLNKIDMQLAEWDMEEANEIASLREKFAEAYKKGGRIGFEAEKALLVKELEAWAEQDSATWEKKTFETTFGKMGFRVSTPAVVLLKKIARNFKEAIGIVAVRIPAYIRQTMELDKEKILAEDRAGLLDTAKLADCGLAVRQEEEFWIESVASKNLEEASLKLKAA